MKDREGWLYKIFLEGPANNYFQFSFDWVIIFLLCVSLVTLLTIYFIKSDNTKRLKIFKCLAVVLFILELTRITLQFGKYSFEAIQAGNGGVYTSDISWPSANLGTLISAISFTWCAFNVWTQVFLLKKNNEKYYKKYGSLVFLLGGFSILAVLLPYGKPNYNIQFIQTVITHFIIAIVPIYMIIDKKIDPKIKDIGKVICQVLVLMWISFFASRLSGSNFLYLKDNTEIFPFLPYVEFPLSLPILCSCYAIMYLVIVGIYNIVKKIRANRSKQIIFDE